MSGTDTVAEIETQRRIQRLPPYKLVLHNDDVNTFEHVIITVMKLTPLSEIEAIEKTLEAHESGRSILLVTNQERAELYVEQFASSGLIATGEPDV